MKKISLIFTACVTLSLLLTSCKLPARSVQKTTQPDPQVIFTAAAQTAEARRAQMALITPTTAPQQLIPTPSPTEAPIDPTPTGPVVATVIVPTEAPPSTDDKAEFVSDVTVPDGTIFAPSEAFLKTWRLKNVGATTWTTAYALVFVSGDLMDGPASVPLPKDVPPGQEVEISVNFVAPTQVGLIYKGFWKLRNASGQMFGVGPSSADPIWLIISVAGTVKTATPAGIIVTGVTLAVDNAAFTGKCPQTLTFTAQFTLSKPTTVTYFLEAASETGAEVKLPPPATRNLESGAHTLIYQLTFASSLKGWVRLRFTTPENVVSNQVNFSIACQ